MRFGTAFCRQTLHQSGVIVQGRKLRHPNIVNAMKHATVLNQVSTASKRVNAKMQSLLSCIALHA